MVVFTGKKFNHSLSQGEVPRTLYGMSSKGWMDQGLFSTWFLQYFLKHAVSERPLLLMLDGHSSHYTLQLVKAAAENVILFCLPLHTTADSQPLDASCFGPLKTFWFETSCQWQPWTGNNKVLVFSPICSGLEQGNDYCQCSVWLLWHWNLSLFSKHDS